MIDELKPWAAVAERVVFVPKTYARTVLNRQQVMDMLRCSVGDVEELVSAGLPVGSGEDGPTFDHNDIYNLGTYSERGDTQPERAFQMLFRFMKAAPDKLIESQDWTFRVDANCAACGRANDGGDWTFSRPSTEGFGGRSTLISEDRKPGSASVEYVVTNGGRLSPIKAGSLLELSRAFLDMTYQWQMLPSDMQVDYRGVHASGVTNCISASLDLAEQFRGAGFQAAAKRGWFCGVLGGVLELPHAWVEVVDSDGVLKVVDIATALLARRQLGTENFQKLCIGTPFNRVIPSTSEADDPVVRHACVSPSDTQVDVRTQIRRKLNAH